jgi:hypothetical protein
MVVVDEAQLFAPAVAGEVSNETCRASLGVMTNLMCRGRKRGLAGVIATQRLAKLAKNVAAEASNFLMGRTFLDIDMARAADLLGMERRQAEVFRDLGRGHFVALKPALSRRSLQVHIGPVETVPRSSSPKLMPLPTNLAGDVQDLILDPSDTEPLPRPRPPRAAWTGTPDILVQLARSRPVLPPEPTGASQSEMTEVERETAIGEILRDILSDPDGVFRSVSVLYQDFLVRCRMRQLGGEQLPLAAFRRRLALARTGVDAAMIEAKWERAIAVSAMLPDDLQGVFLLLARAALDGGYLSL